MSAIAVNPPNLWRLETPGHSGWTRTAGQAYRAEREARSVQGVRYVQNEIRPRIGGSV